MQCRQLWLRYRRDEHDAEATREMGDDSDVGEHEPHPFAADRGQPRQFTDGVEGLQLEGSRVSHGTPTYLFCALRDREATARRRRALASLWIRMIVTVPCGVFQALFRPGSATPPEAW